MLPLTCLEIQLNLFLRKKCPCLKFFWSIFSAFGLNKEKYRIQSECKKIRTKKTPNTNSFYAAFKWVKISLCNTLTTNTPNHIETSQLICIANQLTWFYMMGYINVVNGLSYLCKVILKYCDNLLQPRLTQNQMRKKLSSETFEICCRKLVLRILVPLLFN